MATIYVARSATFSKWASDVGLGKTVFKVGVADDPAAARAAVEQGWAGEADWRIVSSRDDVEVDEAAALERLARKEKPVDPGYYPRLKGAAGIFRVSVQNVQNSLLVAQAMASTEEPLSVRKATPKDIADHLIRNALG